MTLLVCPKSNTQSEVITGYTEPHGEPGIVPTSHTCEWCGDWFVVKGAAC